MLTRYQTNTSAEVLDTITNIQPKESAGGSGVTRESIVHNMACDMLGKLPPNYVPHEVRLSGKLDFSHHFLQQLKSKFCNFCGFKVKAKLLKMGPLNPMNIFLRQEVDRMQRIISVVRTSLTDLNLAIDGTIIMSEVRSLIHPLLILKHQRFTVFLKILARELHVCNSILTFLSTINIH